MTCRHDKAKVFTVDDLGGIQCDRREKIKRQKDSPEMSQLARFFGFPSPKHFKACPCQTDVTCVVLNHPRNNRPMQSRQPSLLLEHLRKLGPKLKTFSLMKRSDQLAWVLKLEAV